MTRRRVWLHALRLTWWRLAGTPRVRTEEARRKSPEYVPLAAIEAWESRQYRHIAAVVQFDARHDRLAKVRVQR